MESFSCSVHVLIFMDENYINEATFVPPPPPINRYKLLFLKHPFSVFCMAGYNNILFNYKIALQPKLERKKSRSLLDHGLKVKNLPTPGCFCRPCFFEPYYVPSYFQAVSRFSMYGQGHQRSSNYGTLDP